MTRETVRKFVPLAALLVGLYAGAAATRGSVTPPQTYVLQGAPPESNSAIGSTYFGSYDSGFTVPKGWDLVFSFPRWKLIVRHPSKRRLVFSYLTVGPDGLSGHSCLQTIPLQTIPASPLFPDSSGSLSRHP